MDFGPSTMQQLAELLRPPEPEVIQGDELPPSPYEITSTRGKLPAPIQDEKKTPKNIEEYEEQEAKEAEEASKIGYGIGDRKVPDYTMNYQQAEKKSYEITSTRGKLPAPIQDEKKTPKNIEEYEEQEAKEAEEASKIGYGIADRKVPDYTMNYQQAVTAEDVYLQIGPKTPGSASCEHLIVRIKMPGDKKENVDLAVDTNTVTIDSSQYHLKLPLPHGINPDRSKANWDSSEETLILTLQLDREFDFINL